MGCSAVSFRGGYVLFFGNKDVMKVENYINYRCRGLLLLRGKHRKHLNLCIAKGVSFQTINLAVKTGGRLNTSHLPHESFDFAGWVR